MMTDVERITFYCESKNIIFSKAISKRFFTYTVQVKIFTYLSKIFFYFKVIKVGRFFY